jgi:phytoene dehydrogenase-like protein
VLEALELHDFIKRENIVYLHCSLTKEWQQWTARKWGFVGGYPQFMRIKPWQMNGHRLKTKSKRTTAYICGDTTYPGQGIPGAALSGIIAAEKLMADCHNQS